MFKQKNKLPSQWTKQATQQNQEVICKALLGAREAMIEVRTQMRQMGEASGVPVSRKSPLLLLPFLHQLRNSIPLK